LKNAVNATVASKSGAMVVLKQKE